MNNLIFVLTLSDLLYSVWQSLVYCDRPYIIQLGNSMSALSFPIFGCDPEMFTFPRSHQWRPTGIHSVQGFPFVLLGSKLFHFFLIFMLKSQRFQGPHRLLRTDMKVETRLEERCQLLKIAPEPIVFTKSICSYSCNVSPFLIFKYISQKILSFS